LQIHKFKKPLVKQIYILNFDLYVLRNIIKQLKINSIAKVNGTNHALFLQNVFNSSINC